MKYRRFKNSDLETSIIGLGGWSMGRGMYGSKASKSGDEEKVVKDGGK